MGAHRELARPFSPGPTMIGCVECERSKSGRVNDVVRSSMTVGKHGQYKRNHDRRKIDEGTRKGRGETVAVPVGCDEDNEDWFSGTTMRLLVEVTRRQSRARNISLG